MVGRGSPRTNALARVDRGNVECVVPFVQATLWVLDGSTTWAAVAFFGLPATLAFFFGPMAVGTVIWWLASFVREPDD